MQLIDTHCHFDLLENPAKVLEKAKQVGVETIIAPAVHGESLENLIKLAADFSGVWVAAGLHPIDTKDETKREKIDEQEIELVENYLQKAREQKNKIIAIGECGLDFATATDADKKIQIQLFKQHLDWAQRFQLPLILHNRKAGEELVELITSYESKEKLRGVFHCFTGSKKLVKEVLDLDFYIGVGGILTLDRGLQEVIKTVPLEKIVLETDSPYLTPRPVKETNPWPNTPANLIHVVNMLAVLKEITPLEVAEITTKNAMQLFSL